MFQSYICTLNSISMRSQIVAPLSAKHLPPARGAKSMVGRVKHALAVALRYTYAQSLAWCALLGRSAYTMRKTLPVRAAATDSAPLYAFIYYKATSALILPVVYGWCAPAGQGEPDATQSLRANADKGARLSLGY